MPHASIKLIPGVDQNKTIALNEAAISSSQLIRFIPDRNGIGLPQKLGGWTKFFPNTVGSIVRCLWAWADINSADHLAVGAEEQLLVITNNSSNNITPLEVTDNVPVDASTTIDSDVVTIVDATTEVSDYCTVYIKTQISVGGLVLFGLYPCTYISPTSYSIKAKNIFGEPAYATSTVANAGDVPTFETTDQFSIVTVNLADHGLNPGDTFPILVSTTVSGITLYGNYIVETVTSSSAFTIQASNAANATTVSPVAENGGDARYTYFIGTGPLPSGTGYGILGYGEGGYGTGVTPSPAPGDPISVEDWTLDNWGSILIANPYNGPIYQWNPITNAPQATVITNAPTVNHGIFVAMPQRQIVAWGSTFTGIHDPLLIRWCDIENYNDWIGTVTNQAGSYRLPRGSKIVMGIQGPQQGLIWTDLAVWAMQYTGQPYVYGFNEIATGCGLIGRKAAGSMNGIVYWMSQSQFFQLAGDGVKPIRCPIWDVIFQDLDTDNLDKIRIAPNSRFGEVSWYYPTKDTGEVNKYVKYNVILDQWDFGTLARTAWINQSVFGPPIGAAPNQYIYQHETSVDADGQPMTSNFKTGYFAVSDADVKQFVDQVWPDMKWGYYNNTQNANVNLTFYVADYPGQTPIVYGPYSLTQTTQFISPRFRARLMSIEIGSNDIGSFWRLGNMRYRTQPDGKY